LRDFIKVDKTLAIVFDFARRMRKIEGICGGSMALELGFASFSKSRVELAWCLVSRLIIAAARERAKTWRNERRKNHEYFSTRKEDRAFPPLLLRGLPRASRLLTLAGLNGGRKKEKGARDSPISNLKINKPVLNARHVA